MDAAEAGATATRRTGATRPAAGWASRRGSRSGLLDAKLWIKTPGESDGPCTRGLPAGSTDPEWGRVDPPAGQWFSQQAAQLLRLSA